MFKSILLTSVQFLMLGIILYANPWFVHQPFLFGIQLLGLFIGIWAIAEMSKSKLNIAPNIRQGAILISSGPYRIIRHPMYLTLLLFLLPILIMNSNIANWIAFSILFTNMLLKLLYEENLLTERFEDYSAYKEKTWRLIPYLF